jgi:hypothetical protein
MVALVATIHDFFGAIRALLAEKDVDGRHKADHDGRVKCACVGTAAPERPQGSSRSIIDFTT